MRRNTAARGGSAPNPYVVLGVAPGSGADAVKRAYRKLAKEWHPDAAGGDLERFLEAQRAYETLVELEREIGARKGAAAPRNAAREPDRNAAEPVDFGTGSGPETESEPAAGPAAGPAPEPVDGEDRIYDLSIPLTLAARGGKARLTLESGRSVSFSLPEGVETGRRMRLKGQGAPGRHGGKPGDALVDLIVTDMADGFERQGDDIYSDLRISWAAAALGAMVEAETLYGRVRLRAPKGATSGTVLRLKGAGFARRGSHCFRLRVAEAPGAGVAGAAAPFRTALARLADRWRDLLARIRKPRGN